MDVLKLGFTDTIEPIANFFITVLSQRYQVIRDDANPDYLIFGDRNFGNNNVNYKKCIKIFYTGENQRYWDYFCDHAITFDHFDDHKHYRLPLYVIYDFENKRKGIANSDDYNREFHDLNEPRKFCSFVVQNPSCQKRNNFFQLLSQYKKVDAAGPLFNNVGYVLERGDRSVEAKLEFINKYKFNMCFENASYPGYATEKLFEAFCGKTIPIYWGSPTIEVDFNPKAFLNWHDYQDDNEFLKRIIELDNDNDEYVEMYLQPMFRDYEKNKFFDQDRFLNWFHHNVYKGVLNV